MPREIPLTRGYVAIVDDEDYERAASFRWYASSPSRRSTPYAVRKIAGVNGRSTCWLHRFILSVPAGTLVDHIDGDGMNNRRGNLRLCTNTQNCRNRAIGKNNRSGFKGVYRYRDGRFGAWIMADLVGHHLGYHPTKEDAARAYDEAAVRLHGEFARLNFPLPLAEAA